MSTNPDSLLLRFFGMHRVKIHRGPEYHFAVFGNVFYTPKTVHRKFDLKVPYRAPPRVRGLLSAPHGAQGAWVGREVTEKERAAPKEPVWKARACNAGARPSRA
jgi:hypothetical protein